MIQATGLEKQFRIGKLTVPALRGASFAVAKGTFAAICGPSGCGKSTLLYVLGGLLQASGGRATIGGFDITGGSDAELTRFRREHIGFVFQRFNLIGSLSIQDNLRMACRIQGRSDGARARIAEVLELVGIAHKSRMKPLELSQGEQQRAAIARALIKEPQVLLADEPTGNLDSENSLNIMELFKSMGEERQQTILMITHDRILAEMTDTIIEMKDGRILSGEGPGRELDGTILAGAGSGMPGS